MPLNCKLSQIFLMVNEGTRNLRKDVKGEAEVK